MKPNTNPTQINKKTSHRASITGGVLAIVSLILAAVGSALVRANVKTPASTTAEKIDAAVADTTVNVLAKLLSMPFLVVSITLACLAIIFTVIRIRKVRVGGLLLSVLWVAASWWALSIAISAFQLLKAN